MYTSVLYQTLVLKPQYQISKTKMLYLEEQMKPRVKIEMKTVMFDDFTDSEDEGEESEIELVFGDEEFKRILENHYNSDKFFDSDEEWEMIMKENTLVDSEYNTFFDSDSEGESADEYEISW
jgi:hypothetical protein